METNLASWFFFYELNVRYRTNALFWTRAFVLLVFCVHHIERQRFFGENRRNLSDKH